MHSCRSSTLNRRGPAAHSCSRHGDSPPKPCPARDPTAWHPRWPFDMPCMPEWPGHWRRESCSSQVQQARGGGERRGEYRARAWMPPYQGLDGACRRMECGGWRQTPAPRCGKCNVEVGDEASGCFPAPSPRFPCLAGAKTTQGRGLDEFFERTPTALLPKLNALEVPVRAFVAPLVGVEAARCGLGGRAGVSGWRRGRGAAGPGFRHGCRRTGRGARMPPWFRGAFC